MHNINQLNDYNSELSKLRGELLYKQALFDKPDLSNENFTELREECASLRRRIRLLKGRQALIKATLKLAS